MRPSSRLLLVKYALKSALLRVAPNPFWAMRRMLKGLYEPELALLPLYADRTRAGFDIGANFGLWSSAMLPHFAQVHAFEPIPWLAGVLEAGHGKRLHVHRLALSDRTGSAVLRVPRANLGFSTIAPENRLASLRDASQSVRAIDVRTARLDDLALPDPAFIKIDVEGHELAVVEGAINVIARARPVLVIESEDRHAPGAAEKLRTRLTAMGYRMLHRPDHRNYVFLPDGNAG